MVSLRSRYSGPNDGAGARRDDTGTCTGEPTASEEYDATPTATSTPNKTGPTEPPPPYETSAASAQPRHGALPQRGPQSDTDKPRTWGQRRATVSTLPLDKPSSRWLYIGDREDYTIPALEPAAAAPGSLSRCRRLARRVYAGMARRFNHHVDGTRTQPGEIERPVTTSYDWTASWEYIINLQWAVPGNEEWRAFGCIYLNDLPGLLCERDPWTGAEQLNADLPCEHEDQDYNYRFTREWRFGEPAGGRWAANIVIAHNCYQEILDIDDPWAFPTPGSLFV